MTKESCAVAQENYESYIADARELFQTFLQTSKWETAKEILNLLRGAEVARFGDGKPTDEWTARDMMLEAVSATFPKNKVKEEWQRLRGQPTLTVVSDNTTARRSPRPKAPAPAAASEINPFAGINPDDTRLKKLSGDARLELKTMGDGYFHILRADKLTYAAACEYVKGLPSQTPPSEKALRTLVGGMVMGGLAEQYVTDVFDKVVSRWKSVTKKVLKRHLEICRYILDAKNRIVDNMPEEARAGICIVNQNNFLDQVDVALTGLEAANKTDPNLFRYGTELGRVRSLKEEGTTDIEIIGKDAFRGILTRASSFYLAESDESMRGVPAPFDVTADLFATQDLPLPYLQKVTVSPSFDADGNLLDRPGYHPAAYAYYAPPEGFVMPRVSATPSGAELLEAKKIIISDYLGDFPFDGYSRREIEVSMGVAVPKDGEEVRNPPASLLSFLAFLLQTPVRSIIGRSPLPALLVTKPEAGSGATKLIESAQIAILGTTSTRAAFPKEEDERRKQVFSALKSGTAFMLFDNVKGLVDSPVLATLLTSTTFTDRELGRSLERSIPNLASVAITGNNPKFTDELVRRLSLCRLDAGVPNPDKRTDFLHEDLEGWVAENRGRILWALCTLVRHWVATGRVEATGTPLQSYVPWYRTVGGILQAAGWEGFQSNRDDLKTYASADEDDPIQSLIQAWYDEGYKRSGMVAHTAYTGGDKGLAVFCDAHALTLPASKRKLDGETCYDPTSLGHFLSKHGGRVFCVLDPDKPGGTVNVALIAGSKDNKGKPWHLEVRESGTRKG